MIDLSIVGAHQHRARTRKGKPHRAIGDCRGGLSTKIHTTTNALGNPIGFHPTSRQACDLKEADNLLSLVMPKTKSAYITDQRVQQPLEEASKMTVIQSKANSKAQTGI